MEEIVVLVRDDAADHDEDVGTTEFFQFGDQLRKERFVTGRQRTEPHYVDIVLHGLLGRFFRRLEKRTDVDVETEIGEGGRDDFGAAIVSVLADLGHKHARTSSMALFEIGTKFAHLGDLFVLTEFASVDAGDRSHYGHVPTIHLFHRVGNLAERGADAGGVDGQGKQIPPPALRRFGQGFERRLDLRVVPFGAELLELRDLFLAHGRIVDFENVERGFFGQPVFVHPDDGLAAGINAGLAPGGGFLDAHLGQTGVDCLGHAAELFHFDQVRPRAFHEVAGQAFNVIGAAPRIDRAADAAFFLQKDLCVSRDGRRKIGRERDGLIERIGVQRLRSTEGRGHGFDAGADHVVVGILFGQAPSRGLRVRAQGQRLGILGPEIAYELSPEDARGAHLGDFHE